ncbi:MAG: hypothetical protein QOG94_1277, partial [Solirubrobacteraceae bacterium]|nr:hypothetical protein [Solirubrobacteraceae bacterium]
MHWGAARTSVDTITRYGDLADRGEDPAVAAKAWTEAGFDDEMAGRWL